ncbi:MAG TPA: Hsp20/alpha crystallin family protein [Anaerolineae bacterium]|nr:Hsp20/alpha crystallin family protein [Anaerolineae bacterium]HOR01510.1 Hsp20/alpha crystallin family protein [Anaerolineae bacterium]HPL28552.1 Hsp20/alpha crystallin family protein [Anaerolineae bacterium]
MGSIGVGRADMEWALSSNRQAFRPPFDVFETDESIVIRVEIAGMREEDFDISLDGHVLHIGGSRGDSSGKLAYQRMEINYGEFRLDIRLPRLVALSEIEASYEKGFLSVSVPRQPQRRRIPIAEVDEES